MDKGQPTRKSSKDEEKSGAVPQGRRESAEIEDALELGSVLSSKPRLSGGTTPTAEIDRSGDEIQKGESSEPGEGGGEEERSTTETTRPEEGGQEQQNQPRSTIVIQGGEFVASQFAASSITFQEVHHHHLAQSSVHLGFQQNLAIGLAHGQNVPSLPGTSTLALPSPSRPTSSSLAAAVSGLGQGQGTSTADAVTGVNRNLRSAKVVTNSDGVITTYKNLNGGSMSVSKRVERIIAAAEMKFQLGEIYVTFPQGSFRRETRVILIAEIDNSKWRGQFIGDTPTLYIEAPDLQKDLDIRLPSWSVGGQRSTSRLWHCPKGSTTWKPTEISKPFTDNPYFDLKRRDFSPIAMGSEPIGFGFQAEETGKRVAGGVYTSDESDLTIAFHLDDSGSGNRSMAAEWAAEDIARLTNPRGLRLTLKSLEARTGEAVSVKISCEPQTLRTHRRDQFRTTIDRDFVRNGYEIHNTTIVGDEKKSQIIDVTCELLKSGTLCKEDTFSYPWTPRIISATRRRPSAAPAVHLMTNRNLVAVDTPEGQQSHRVEELPEDDDAVGSSTRHAPAAAVSPMTTANSAPVGDEEEDDRRETVVKQHPHQTFVKQHPNRVSRKRDSARSARNDFDDPQPPCRRQRLEDLSEDANTAGPSTRSASTASVFPKTSTKGRRQTFAKRHPNRGSRREVSVRGERTDFNGLAELESSDSEIAL